MLTRCKFHTSPAPRIAFARGAYSPEAVFGGNVMHYRLALATLLASCALPAFAQTPAAPTLDYEYFKARIQPILTTKRDGNARCISCHGSGTTMRLQPLAEGAATWSDADARKNLHRAIRSTVRVLGRRGGSHTGDMPRGPDAVCPRDGTPLQRRTVGGRTTYSCPAHQH